MAKKIFLILVIFSGGFFNIVFAGDLININTADIAALDALPGIGESKAQAIIDYRSNNGLFNTIDEITNVSGIGEVTFNDIRDLITIGDVVLDDHEPQAVPEELSEPQEEQETSIEPSTPSPISSEEMGMGDIVINEFVSDPGDEEVEWVEFYNNKNEQINLSGWSVEDGSGVKTSFSGVIKAKSFYVLEKPKGNLNNKGDVIILRVGENLIDKVVYGEWDEKGAPVAGDPYSIARVFDGYNTFNNSNDFRLSISPSKGEPNIIIDPESENDNLAGNSFDYSKNIVISEILPNPKGVDTDDEYVEIFNAGQDSVDLFGWKIGDSSGKCYEFKEETRLKAEEYLVIFRKESGIALNNTSDSVDLYQPLEEKVFKSVTYEKATEGRSYNLILGTKKYVWSESSSPGEAYAEIKLNHAPLVDFSFPDAVSAGMPIIFDSSDTEDEDEDVLSFGWDFGDGIRLELASPQHTFLKAGIFNVSLSVSDGKESIKKEKLITVLENFILDNEGSKMLNASGTKIEISEFLPNPAGSDNEGEFVEIHNPNNFKINLANWKFDDAEGGSKPFEFKTELWLGPNDFYSINRKESGLALNNNQDAIRILDLNGEVVDEVRYEKSFENRSYSKDKDGKWVWTDEMTPDEENLIAVSSSPSGKIVIKKAAGNKSTVQSTDINEVKNFSVGDKVKISGAVIVLPGVLSSQYFYIMDAIGLQIYSYKKDYPDLMIGDLVEVSGELSQINGENRLKTKQAGDIKIIGHQELPSPEKLNSDQVNEEILGCLIRINGKVIDKKGSSIFLDDGYGEAELYIKASTGINTKDIKEEDQLSATGIVSKNKSNIIIMPRSNDDIIRDIGGNQGQVLGGSEEKDEWDLEKRDKRNEVIKYLLVIVGGAGIFLFFAKMIK